MYLFFGDELLTDRIDFVGADTVIEGFRDRQVQAGEQLVLWGTRLSPAELKQFLRQKTPELFFEVFPIFGLL